MGTRQSEGHVGDERAYIAGQIINVDGGFTRSVQAGGLAGR